MMSSAGAAGPIPGFVEPCVGPEPRWPVPQERSWLPRRQMHHHTPDARRRVIVAVPMSSSGCLVETEARGDAPAIDSKNNIQDSSNLPPGGGAPGAWGHQHPGPAD